MVSTNDEGNPMKNLHYATAANERHSVTVKTWEERGLHRYEIRVDGTMRDSGSVGRVAKSAEEAQA